MPASIELLPRKEFKITLEDGSIVTGKFGTWALKRFCTKKNLSLSQLGDSLTTNLSIDDMVEFILCAVEQSFREQKTQTSFPYNDVDVCKWIDDIGGIGADDTTRLFNHAADQEKKSNDLAAA